MSEVCDLNGSICELHSSVPIFCCSCVPKLCFAENLWHKTRLCCILCFKNLCDGMTPSEPYFVLYCTYIHTYSVVLDDLCNEYGIVGGHLAECSGVGR